jgi:soluble lytic murein transglycosylase
MADELYAPALNLDLGGWYLGRLWERFGHPGLVAAAYNAGPGAVLRWTAARPKESLDLFIEDIPYKETRGYVKQVMADYFNYIQLYAMPGSHPAWSWEVPKPREQGVGF